MSGAATDAGYLAGLRWSIDQPTDIPNPLTVRSAVEDAADADAGRYAAGHDAIDVLAFRRAFVRAAYNAVVGLDMAAADGGHDVVPSQRRWMGDTVATARAIVAAAYDDMTAAGERVLSCETWAVRISADAAQYADATQRALFAAAAWQALLAIAPNIDAGPVLNPAARARMLGMRWGNDACTNEQCYASLPQRAAMIERAAGEARIPAQYRPEFVAAAWRVLHGEAVPAARECRAVFPLTTPEAIAAAVNAEIAAACGISPGGGRDYLLCDAVRFRAASPITTQAALDDAVYCWIDEIGGTDD